MKTIFDNTETSFILVKRDLKIVSFNKAAQVGFTKDAGETLNVGKSMLDFVAKDKQQRSAEMYKRVFEGEQFKLEDNHIRKDGKHSVVSYAIVTDLWGKITRFLR